MKLLLDTHVFLWYVTGADDLASTCREATSDPANDV